ncbi:MAG: 5-oxoprolinase [Verrucomicrobia bacterium]|jgi:5-oxoprolinase (ATP-hydrolysing)|nr:5-oxoprolinase [Verrucomicrobiota bacterium]
MTALRLSFDTGGTFTDGILEGPEGEITRTKVLSSGRLRGRVEKVDTNRRLFLSEPLFPAPRLLAGCAVLIAGKPAGTIARLEGRSLLLRNDFPSQPAPGELIEVETGMEAPVLGMVKLLGRLPGSGDALRLRLGTTKGTNALLEGKGAKVAMFITAGFEDLLRIGDQKRPDLFALDIEDRKPLYHRVYGVPGRLAPDGREREALDPEKLRAKARTALDEGCEVAAVCLLHSWCTPVQEQATEEVLRAAGFGHVFLSHEVSPRSKLLDRAETVLVDALLGPVLGDYLDRVQEEAAHAELRVMTSAGGLVARQRFHAVDSLISGPAGGVMGAVTAGRRAGWERILSLDMGGTSTDVSRWAGQRNLREGLRVGAARVQRPALRIETVAAGGGSICMYSQGRYDVGPGSAGADPGPAAYGAGGPLCLSDIHFFLGRMDPEGFSIPLDADAPAKRLEEMLQQSGDADPFVVAEGLLAIATERMAQAIRQVTLREGEDPARYGLVVFGGAGGLHACRLADLLGIREILFPAEAGLLSARGIHESVPEAVEEEEVLENLDDLQEPLAGRLARLVERAVEQLSREDVEEAECEVLEQTVALRLRGQEATIEVGYSTEKGVADAFGKTYERQFGYSPADDRLEVVSLRVRVAEKEPGRQREIFPDDEQPAPEVKRQSCRLEGRQTEVPVIDRTCLQPGMRVEGPAIVRDPFGTCFVEAGWEGLCGDAGSVWLTPAEKGKMRAAGQSETILRSLVANRLESLVGEMGEQLQRTALSPNIRERLDFSCAFLDAEGRLIMNAPHIPVHLGALGLCVRTVMQEFSFRPGDVLVTNHPAYGGSHLPDVTLVTGLFDEEQRLIGFLANRAHHAEIGGRSPASMPPDARCLAEEGVVLPPRWLVRDGTSRLDEVEALLREAPFPSRTPRENRMDLEAQLASLQRGRRLSAETLREVGSERLRAYLARFHEDAANALRERLEKEEPRDLRLEERIDDGHCIRLHLRLRAEGVVFDFSGTDAVHPRSLNATPAIVRSAVLYLLRLYVNRPLPLNEGLLERVEVNLPACFLNPPFPEDPRACPAVVGGNVETSQRLVDMLVRGLGLAAGGQATMNNLLFGNKRFGYYETIGGGAGATARRRGGSGTHVHMTNTAITDPEVLELRFPVQCREFSLRSGSGGEGRHPGGDGLVRELRFLEEVEVSLLGQRRVQGAPGLEGGGDGLPGMQYKITTDGGKTPVGGECHLHLLPGEGIRLETPGGGGWGAPE